LTFACIQISLQSINLVKSPHKLTAMGTSIQE
jgi:hypothetical protein